MTDTPAPWRLSELARGMFEVAPSLDREVRGLATDSRAVGPGDLFVALPGASTDGSRFIAQAAARGAVAALTEAGASAAGAAIPVFAVAGLRARLGWLADRFYGSPSRALVVVGVTGTNGKTTCTQLLAQALDRPGERCALVGTLGYGFPGELDPGRYTTPDAVTLHRLLATFRARGARRVAVEVSSHALAQGRVGAVAFHTAVFTNLTRDHLDYHGDMSAYGAAKASLFAVDGLRQAVINRDDGFGRGLLDAAAGRLPTVSFGMEAGDVRALAVQATPQGLAVRVATPEGEAELRTALFGRFNVYNLLAVLATLLRLGMELPEAVQRLGGARAPCGRVERFGGRAGAPLVVVDYAHTPDALEKVLLALREHARGRLWCVFGCGGDRDRGKRPLMGAIAERLADAVVLTDDNPRGEPPDQIIADIRAGMRGSPRVIRDRAVAIAETVAALSPDDVVLIAGKGHEDYQQIGEQRLAYSDQRAVREVLGARA